MGIVIPKFCTLDRDSELARIPVLTFCFNISLNHAEHDFFLRLCTGIAVYCNAKNLKMQEIIFQVEKGT